MATNVRAMAADDGSDVTAGELVLVVAAVLCCLGFTALVVVLMRVLDALRDVRRELDDLRAETTPLILELQDTTDEARATVERSPRRSRALRSGARFRRSDQRRRRRHRDAHVVLDTDDQGGGAGPRYLAYDRPPSGHPAEPGDRPDDRSPQRRDRLAEPGCHRGRAHDTVDRTETEATHMMKRVTWFAGGVVAGVATAGYAKTEGQGDGVADRTGADGPIGGGQHAGEDRATSSTPSARDAW